jgi:serine/threonine protein kinase
MMEEIELMRGLDCPHIVGYIDSFIDSDLSINIIIEYCVGGDLQTYIAKQTAANLSKKGSVLHDNFIWKVFIQVCLGL